MLKKHPELVVLAIVVLLFASKFVFFHYYVGTAFQQVLMVAVSAAQGYALGWFLSPKGKTFRTFLFIGGSILLVAVAIGDQGSLGWGVTTLIAAICFILAFSSWFKIKFNGFFEKPTTFGSAEWASFDYLKKNDLLGRGDCLHLGHVPGPKGLYPVAYKGDRHALLVAPTRAKKGTAAIIPTLLTYTGSTLVIDPKGENAMITRAAREAMGQTVHVVDPWGIVDGGNPPARYNPLDCLVPGDPDIGENAMIIADALVTPSGTDRFWDDEAKSFYQGTILHVATDEEEVNDRHLGRVRDLSTLEGLDLKSLFLRMAQSAHPIVASTGRRFLQKDEKLLSNVMSSVQAHTNFLDSPRVRESLSASDFKFEDLKTTPMSVFLVLPADRISTFERWLRLLIQQAITVNARNIAVRPKKPVLFVLDEMAALGRLTMVEQAFGLMAGFGIQLWGVVQDLGQLKQIYGDRYEGMIANSGVIQYFGSRDRLTTEYFSALCGVTTVWNLSSAVSRAFSSQTGSGGSSSITNSSTTAQAQRKLAYPDELMRVDPGQQLIFIENHHPIRATREPWFKIEHLRNLGRNLHAEQAAKENNDG